MLDQDAAAPAWDDRPSRAAWASYRAAGLRLAVAGALSLLLVVGGGALLVSRSHALLTGGVATVGMVTAADGRTVSISYDADGATFRQTLAIVSGRSYRVGQAVDVRYDAADPATGRLVDEPARLPGVGPAFALLALAAVVALPIGVGALLRAGRWRAAMQAAPWTLVHLQSRGRDLVLSSGQDAITARLLTTTRWRTKTVHDIDGHELWMLPVGQRGVLLTADGAGTVYGARRR